MNWITEAIRRYRDFPILEQSLHNQEAKIDKLNSHLEVAQKELVRAISQVPAKLPVDDAASWDDKWARSTIWYSAPQSKKLTEYLAYRRIPEIEQIIKEKGFNSSDDKVPWLIMDWLQLKFKSGEFSYILDKGEKWNTPEQTLKEKKGDCDDFGLLEYFLIREVFMQLSRWEEVKHRLKCVVGHVHNTDKVNTYAGLHFYLLWLADDGEFYTVESTFYRERAIINWLKTPHKLNEQYSLIAFTFNETWMWAQNSLILDKLDFKKVAK